MVPVRCEVRITFGERWISPSSSEDADDYDGDDNDGDGGNDGDNEVDVGKEVHDLVLELAVTIDAANAVPRNLPGRSKGTCNDRKC